MTDWRSGRLREIHPTAVIHPSVELPEGMYVGAYSVIGQNVKFLGPSRLHERVSIHGRTEISAGCEFFPGAVIGTIPQDLKYSGEITELRIGRNNVFREYVTVHLGTVPGGGVTRLGDNNLFMAYVHIAHDCHLGGNIIMANGVGLSGHVEVQDWAVLGGMTGVIQFARVGRHAHIGGQMRITKDVAPYCRVAGEDKVRIIGVNSIGLQRRGFGKPVIDALKEAVRVLVSPKHTVAEALDLLEKSSAPPEVLDLVRFVRASQLGIHR
ncbi:MAG: acyl-[acyl-carrier-protein]--UDP-N-acetylglucosamine O-acyltransferase [Candidatus Lindowbacteria bacterium RIFCSPLOWO2_12_FULL_62_27]|nr:MAG: acyl-[acyl-carrier-protein]--UDP-N-acetylglucosamine O-acyltransferase [Candidatus Lindowbacteria bacterium RIFCSPLOWO2_12_FULL_62_27]OGH63618.1 MAG: acyl-[acyl-carrier-protein]--UDP-N-acetylglucosamine O-acyltransferase [Candidatus Lindowbacteria bacterium RIFCSPLOWO2_02_FULL_62_12]